MGAQAPAAVADLIVPQIFKTISLPLPPGAGKMALQQVVHAIEELYYFRRYQEALDFIKTLHDDVGGPLTRTRATLLTPTRQGVTES